jgi:hypothetical protein
MADRTIFRRDSRLRSTPPPAALTLAAFLIAQPGQLAVGEDANLATHTRLRCTSLQGDRVHRLDSARGLKFYTTRCGLRVPKVSGVLTAADVDCLHYGCGRGRDGES